MLKSISALIALLLLSSIIGCKELSLETLKNNQPLTIKGRVTQVGNAPFQQYAIQVEKYNTTLPIIIKHKKNKSVIQTKLGKKVEINGILRIENRQTADLKKQIKSYQLIVEEIQ